MTVEGREVAIVYRPGSEPSWNRFDGFRIYMEYLKKMEIEA
jgi:hypothetical protein